MKGTVELSIDDYNEILSTLRNLRRCYFTLTDDRYAEEARSGIEKIGRILTYRNETKEEDE